MATDKKISELPVISSVAASDVSVLVHGGTDYQFDFTTLLQFINSGINPGSVISFGTTLPQNTVGKNGDLFINITAGSFAQKQSGTWSVKYTFPVNNGSDGTVLYGSGVPGTGIGSNNDTYINIETGIFYHKAISTWMQVFSMQTGPQGPKGDKGDTGATGANGKTILNGTSNPSNSATGTNGDLYLNTNTCQLFGPKTGGVWGSGTSVIGLTGEPGESGPQGDTGLAGESGAGVPTGGTTGQVLSKISTNDFDTEWVSVASGGDGILAFKEVIFVAPIYEDESEATSGGIEPYTLYRTSTGELRYKLPTTDDDALTYLSAANIVAGNTYTEKSISGQTIINAVNVLFSSLKSVGIYDKLKALYLYNGATNDANNLNSLSPGTYDLTLAGTPSPTFTSQGMILDLGAFAKTGLKQSDFPTNSLSIGTYFTKNIENATINAFDMGVFDGDSSGFGFAAQAYLPQGAYISHGDVRQKYFRPLRGLKTMCLTSNTTYGVWFEGIKALTGTPGDTIVDFDFWIGGLNFPGYETSNTFKAAGWHGIDFLATGLSDSENMALNVIFETYCTSVKRGTKRIIFNGDSITIGFWSTGALGGGGDNGYFYQSWPHQVANHYGLQADIRAVDGWALADMIADGLEKYIPIKTEQIVKLFFAFGTNETESSTPIDTYKNNYRVVIDYALTKGWNVADICINLGYYDTVFDQTLKDSYIQAALDICNEYGITNYLNSKPIMVGAGGATILENSPPYGTSGLHPNQLGFNAIATAWLNVLNDL